MTVKKALSKLRYTESPSIIDDKAYDILYEACEDKQVQAHSSSTPAQHSPNQSGHGTRARYDGEGASTSTYNLRSSQPVYESCEGEEEEDVNAAGYDSSSASQVSGAPSAVGDMMDARSDVDEDDDDLFTQTSPREPRRYIKWSTIDPAAPKINGSAQLKHVTQTCGFCKVQSNGEGAVYCCRYCDLFWRKFVWVRHEQKDTRVITVYTPSEEHVLHHESSCPRASNPWDPTVNEIPQGQSLTPQGRAYVLFSLKSGALPMSITNTINEARLEAHWERFFPNPVSVQQVRNIDAYERERLRSKNGAGPSSMLDTNSGVSDWSDMNHLDQECYSEPRQLLCEIFHAEDETKFDELVVLLKSNPISSQLFVVDVCKDDHNNVVAVTFSNARICVNLAKAIRKLGVNGINISVDGTYQLSKNRWAILTVGTHSIEVDRGSSMLCQKSRTFLYTFALSESKVVFTHQDKSLKWLSSRLFGARIDSLAAVAIDHCDAAWLAFSELNPSAKILLDWTHVIMNARKYLPSNWDDSRKQQLLHTVQESSKSGAVAERSLDSHHPDCDHDPCAPLCERPRSGEKNIKHIIINRMMNDLRALHRCRNIRQFRALAPLILKKWTDVYLQPQAAQWLQEYYLSDAWACFYVSASGILGVTPSTQHLESLHNHLKLIVVHKRRQSNDNIFGIMFQGILSNHGDTFVGDIRRMHSSLPLSFLTLANDIIKFNGDSNANFNIRISAQGPVQMYFHVKPITAGTTAVTRSNHENVTQEKIQLYEDGLDGAGQDSESVETFIAQRMSLHKVAHSIEHGKPVCDCKDFFRLLVCAHSIVYRERANGESILNSHLGHVPTVKTKAGKRISYNGREASGAKSTKRSKVC